MSRWITALIALLLLGLGLPLYAEEGVYVDTRAAETGEELEAPEQLPESAGELLSTEETADGKSEEEDVKGEEDEEEPEEPTFIDAAHGSISSGVLETARWLDSFFSDPRIENEITETRVKVRFSVFAQEDDKVEYNVRANLRLDLPFLKERFQLLISGDPEEEEDFRAISGREGERAALASSDEDFSASLRYFLEDSLKRNISLRSGVRWRNGMPTVFLEPRYRQTTLLDSWLFRFTQRVIGFTDGRKGARTIFDLEREIGKALFFRSSAEGSWESDEDGYAYSLGFSVFKSFSPRRAIIFGLGSSFNTRPHNQLENVAMSVRYRQRILRDWLFYEIIPQVSFPRERDFEATPGILLRLEMLFGHYPILPPLPE
jgi:hypothetical protein